jgi:alkylation response protein AidB-like acyl-CoA dehydrogenase
VPLVLNDEQAMLQDSVRGFLDEHAPVAQLRALRDTRDPHGFSRELWRGFAELGLTGVLVPEAHGGAGLGHVEAGVIMEEIGRRLTATPFLSTAVLGVRALTLGGSQAQQAQHLPAIAAGERLTALAIDEGAKHRPAHIALRAEPHGNGFRLNGLKTFVVDGHVADLLIVAARTGGAAGERSGLTLFLVDAQSEGVDVERTWMVDSRNAARVTFSDVTVAGDAVLGQVDDGWSLLEGVLDSGRAAVAAELTGVGEEAFGRTLAYLRERRQFGRLIGEFQALQHRAAHLFTELEITRAAVMKALQTLDAGPDEAPATVSMAKARAGRTATLAVQEAVQMHGGVGMTDALDIGFFMKRARAAEELLGDAHFHTDRFARLNGY